MEYQQLSEHEKALQNAVMNGDFEGVKNLLMAHTELGIRVNGKDPEYADSTFLHVAAQHGHSDICDYLMAMGGCVYWRNRDALTPAKLAHNSGHYELAERLKEAERQPIKMFEEFYAEFLPEASTVAA